MRFGNPLLLIPGVLIAGTILLIHILSRGKAKKKKFPPVSFLIRLSQRSLTFIKIKDIISLIVRTLIPLLLFGAIAGPYIVTKFPQGKNYVVVIDQSRRFLENINKEDIKGKKFLRLNKDGNFEIDNEIPEDTIDFVYPVDKAFLYLENKGYTGVFFTDMHKKTLKRLIEIKKQLKNTPWIIPMTIKNKKRLFIKNITMSIHPSLKNINLKIDINSLERKRINLRIKGGLNYSNNFEIKKGDNPIKIEATNFSYGICRLYIDGKKEFMFVIPSLQKKVYIKGKFMNFVKRGLSVIPGIEINEGIGYEGTQFISTDNPDTLSLRKNTVVFVINKKKNSGYLKIENIKEPFLKKYIEDKEIKFENIAQISGKPLISLTGQKNLITEKEGVLFVAVPFDTNFTDLVYKKEFIPLLFYLIHSNEIKKLPFYLYAGDTFTYKSEKPEIIIKEEENKKTIKGKLVDNFYMYNISRMKRGIVIAGRMNIPFNYNPLMYDNNYLNRNFVKKANFYVGSGEKNISKIFLFIILFLLIVDLILIIT